MKRFASHYVLIPAEGYLKQQVVEVDGNDRTVCNVFPLTGEPESVEWMPGVIALLTEKQVEEMKKDMGLFFKDIPMSSSGSPVLSSSLCFDDYLRQAEKEGVVLLPYLFYPFDFIAMQPVGGTRHRLLQ